MQCCVAVDTSQFLWTVVRFTLQLNIYFFEHWPETSSLLEMFLFHHNTPTWFSSYFLYLTYMHFIGLRVVF